MNKIDSAYFAWLGNTVDPSGHYEMLNTFLHDCWDFRWSIPMDENREVDGYDLRETFLKTCCDIDNAYAELGNFESATVSVFEVLVALCFRMEHELDDLQHRPRHAVWFAELLRNIGLGKMINEYWLIDSDESEFTVTQIINRLLDRTYDWDGVGGLFPVKDSVNDMREVEIWYQMMAYLDER